MSDLLDALDLSAFYAPYEGDGRRNSPYEPRMMVKVLVYGYATGTFSSRKLATRLVEDSLTSRSGKGTLRPPRTPCLERRSLGGGRAKIRRPWGPGRRGAHAQQTHSNRPPAYSLTPPSWKTKPWPITGAKAIPAPWPRCSSG